MNGQMATVTCGPPGQIKKIYNQYSCDFTVMFTDSFSPDSHHSSKL